MQPCLKQILPCGSEAKHTPGGNITVGNLKFSMQPYKATVQCNQEDDQAAVKISDARANFEDFCAKFDGQVIKGEDDPKSASYHQDVGSTMTTVSLSWAEDIDGCGADGLLYPPYNIMKVSHSLKKILLANGLMILACYRKLARTASVTCSPTATKTTQIQRPAETSQTHAYSTP